MPPAPLPLSRRPGSIVAALFFASHIPVTLLVDSQAGELEKEFPPRFLTLASRLFIFFFPTPTRPLSSQETNNSVPS
jgi:hypothetical protein